MIEERLRALLAADVPPARDLAFQLAVMARIERRQFRRALIANATITIGATALLALVVPTLQGIWRGSQASYLNDVILVIMLIAATYVAMQFQQPES